MATNSLGKNYTVPLPPYVTQRLNSLKVRLGLVYDEMSKLEMISPSSLARRRAEIVVFAQEASALERDLAALEEGPRS